MTQKEMCMFDPVSIVIPATVPVVAVCCLSDGVEVSYPVIAWGLFDATIEEEGDYSAIPQHALVGLIVAEGKDSLMPVTHFSLDGTFLRYAYSP